MDMSGWDDMRLCALCGEDLLVDDRVCPACDAPVEGADRTSCVEPPAQPGVRRLVKAPSEPADPAVLDDRWSHLMLGDQHGRISPEALRRIDTELKAAARSVRPINAARTISEIADRNVSSGAGV